MYGVVLTLLRFGMQQNIFILRVVYFNFPSPQQKQS